MCSTCQSMTAFQTGVLSQRLTTERPAVLHAAWCTALRLKTKDYRLHLLWLLPLSTRLDINFLHFVLGIWLICHPAHCALWHLTGTCQCKTVNNMVMWVICERRVCCKIKARSWEGVYIIRYLHHKLTLEVASQKLIAT